MNPESNSRFNRRIAVSRAGSALGVIVTSCRQNPHPVENKPPETKVPAEVYIGDLDAFKDKDANEIAMSLGISAGSFFEFQPRVLDKLSAFRGDQLYPIYPPSVLKYKKLIYDLSKEFNVPPNIIATIMSIESAGLQEAGSGAGAIGLFQPLADKFPQNILAISDVKERLRAMQEPYNNGRAGIGYFVREPLPAAQKTFQGTNYLASHAVVFARALMGYNAGPSGAYLDFNDLYDETKLYGDHMMRYLITAEVADRLRKKGFSDKDIVRKLSSRQIDARSYALQQFIDRVNNDYSYEEYNKVLDLLSGKKVKINDLLLPQGEAKKISDDYVTYIKKPVYELPLSPGVRIWTSMGGYSLLMQSSENGNKTAWENVTTNR